MARYVTASEVVEVFARGAVRVDRMFADEGDVDTALVTLVHEDGCLTAIDNARQTAYGFDQRVEVFGSGGMAASDNPLEHTGIVLTARGTHRPVLPHFFLERCMHSYVREWEVFVEAVQSGSAPPVSRDDARAPLLIGLAGLAVAARAPAGPAVGGGARVRVYLTGATRPDAIVHAAIWNDPGMLCSNWRRAWDAYVGATRNLVAVPNHEEVRT